MICISLMSQYVAIEQIRLIEANGQESVRVERSEGKIQAVAGEELQNKANRDYVQTINQLPPNSIYFSPISLNQENNVVSMPYQPDDSCWYADFPWGWTDAIWHAGGEF
ncbi:hypothetical protein P4S72_02385 [Vibrio sp. PP-XX7]